MSRDIFFLFLFNKKIQSQFTRNSKITHRYCLDVSSLISQFSLTFLQKASFFSTVVLSLCSPNFVAFAPQKNGTNRPLMFGVNGSLFTHFLWHPLWHLPKSLSHSTCESHLITVNLAQHWRCFWSWSYSHSLLFISFLSAVILCVRDSQCASIEGIFCLTAEKRKLLFHRRDIRWDMRGI